MDEWLLPDPEQPATRQKPTHTKARYSVFTASSLSLKPACGLMQATGPVKPTPSELSRGEQVHHSEECEQEQASQSLAIQRQVRHRALELPILAVEPLRQDTPMYPRATGTVERGI
jgi:hypothetical protein